MNYNKNILKAKLRDALKRISVNVNGKKKTLKKVCKITLSLLKIKNRK